MHSRKTAAVLALSLLAPGTPAIAQPLPAPAASPLRTVTLITGDRVHVDATGVPVHTEAAPQRTGTAFRVWSENGHHHVVPEDAEAPLDAGRLDRRLFDITLLLEFGYDDASTPELPLLLTKAAAPRSATRPGLGFSSLRTKKTEAVKNWTQLRGSVGARSLTGADKVWLNGKLRMSLDRGVPLTGAPAAWKAGHTAKDVTVAVLDTGVDTTHPDLKGVVAKDFSNSPDGPEDTDGHGTHVASIVAGTGAASGGKYAGMTKGARLLAGKVGERSADEEAVIAGVAWAAVENKAKVINMSFGTPLPHEGPLDELITKVTREHGTLFVAAAGNTGADEKVSYPSTADEALSVANTTKQDRLSKESSRGPRFGDHALKPDISAPGSDIVAAKAAGTFGEGSGLPDQYTLMSGTSMSAPHVTGAAAIIAGLHPDWSPGRIKSALMSTARPVAEATVYGQGSGIVDLDRAIRQQVTAEQGSLSLGHFTWPHTGQKPSTKDVTYRNDADRPITLKLDLSLADTKGKPGDSGQFRLSANEVTVPAKGSAKVSVTVDPTQRPGLYGGWLTATAGDTVVRTSIGADVENTMRTLTVKATGRDGKPARPAVKVTGGAVSQTVRIDADGIGTARLPEGEYLVSSTLAEHGPRGEYKSDPVALVQQVAPKVKLDKDITLEADARKAQRHQVSLDDPSVRVVRQTVSALLGTTTEALTYADSDTPLYLGSLGGSEQRFTHVTHLSAVRPELTADVVAPHRVPLFLTYDEQSPKLVGEHRLDVVDGKGSGDLKGKLVLLTLDPKTDDTAKAVKAAADAGAKAALVVQPARPVFQPLALPTFNAAEHRLTRLIDLLKAGPVAVNLVSSKDNPVSYDIALTARSSMVDGGRHEVRKDQLARIDARYRPDGSTTSVRPTMAYAPGSGFPRPQAQGVFRLPAPEVAIGKERTEYVSPGWWLRRLGTDNEPVSEAGYSRFDAGRTYRRDWNTAVFAPAFGDGAVNRIDDKIGGMLSLAAPRPAAEGAPSWIGSAPMAGRTTLLLDGKPLFSTDATSFGGVVPPRQGRYELQVRGTRKSTLTTSVDAAWTFRSGPTPDQTAVALPLLTVDPRLPLDHANAAPAAAPLPIQVFAARQPRAAGRATVTELRVAVSYDEGRTWTDVPVHRAGEAWTGMLPAAGKAGGSGSLRVEAKDSEGNSVRQTVLRTHTLS